MKPTGDLKKYLDTMKTTNRLLGDVERHLLLKEPGDRRTDVLHPSEISKIDWCYRSSYLLLKGAKPLQERPNLRLSSIFEEGHTIHAKWQQWFREMDVLFGNWKCLICEELMEGVSPVECENCGSDLLSYAEVKLSDPKLRIHGNSDGWIRGLGDDCLIEIKSIGAGTIRMEAPQLFGEGQTLQEAWKQIRRPFRSHLMQGQIYLELAKRMYGEDAPKEIVFIYELKADQDYREFVIKADYEFVEHIFEKAEEVVNMTEAPACNISEGGCKKCNGLIAEEQK